MPAVAGRRARRPGSPRRRRGDRRRPSWIGVPTATRPVPGSSVSAARADDRVGEGGVARALVGVALGLVVRLHRVVQVSGLGRRPWRSRSRSASTPASRRPRSASPRRRSRRCACARPAARPGAGGEDRPRRSCERAPRRVGHSGLEVEDDGLGAGLLEVGGLGSDRGSCRGRCRRARRAGAGVRSAICPWPPRTRTFMPLQVSRLGHPPSIRCPAHSGVRAAAIGGHQIQRRAWRDDEQNRKGVRGRLGGGAGDGGGRRGKAP